MLLYCALTEAPFPPCDILDRSLAAFGRFTQLIPVAHDPWGEWAKRDKRPSFGPYLPPVPFIVSLLRWVGGKGPLK